MTRIACSLVTALALCAGSAFAAVINVPADQPTIQAAIAAAANGDEIVVAPGTYNEQINFLGKAIVVRSSSGAANTIISGGGTLSPLVTFAGAETASSVIRGFTLREAGPAADLGGAFSITNAGPQIESCIVVDNVQALTGGAGAYIIDASPTFISTRFANNFTNTSGSALYIAGVSTVNLEDCQFENNEDPGAGGNAGAISITTSTLNITNSIFRNNDAVGGGVGGAISADASTLTINGGRFENNVASDGGLGGAIYSGAGELSVTNVTFIGNQGGAIFVDGGSATIATSNFEDNINEGATGGAVYISGAEATITGSTFLRNQAIGGGGGGVGIDAFLTTSVVTMTDSTFVENETPGGSGAALYVEGSIFANVDAISTTIDRCTFVNNGLLDDPTNGTSGSTIELRRRTDVLFTSSLLTGNTGGVGCVALASNARARVVNCTLVDNVPGPSNRTFFLPATAVLQVRNSIVRGSTASNRRMFPPSLPVAALSVEYSNVSAGYAGIGNINSDPDFVDAVGGDYRLNATSPSVDAGDAAAVPSSSLLDLDGNARIAGPTVDMGAYELGGSIGCDDIDFNNNNVFPEDQDVVDFFEVLAGGTPPTCDTVEGCNDIDFNNNGVFPEDQDVIDFFTVLAGGDCV
jgi:hypothetical protein